MSKYVNISAAGIHTVLQASDYSVNSSTNRRGNDFVKVNKIYITNYDTADATATVYLNGIQISRTVNQTTGTSDKFIFDKENVIESRDLIQVGDEVYDSNKITLHGVVEALNPDGDNTKEIKINTSVGFTEGETLYIQKPDFYITGSITIPAGVTFVYPAPFSFNLKEHILIIKSGTSGTQKLTVRIE